MPPANDEPSIEPLDTDPAQAGNGPLMEPAKPWVDMILEAERYFQDYNERCDNIDKRYGDLKALAAGGSDREFQIFWANMEVMKPRVYSRAPVPVVMPNFRDRRPLPRAASELLERALITAFKVDDVHSTLIEARDDLAQNARGVIWPRYVRDDNGERVCFDHLDRADFLHEPARKWKEVGWVARRDWLTREQMRIRFSPVSGDAWQKANFKERRSEGTRDGGVSEEAKTEPKAPVWTVWHKVRRQVVWLSPDGENLFDMRDPFLDLEGFFPCPKPAYGTVQRRTLIPIPDFLYYKDQVEEINELTARISSLAEALKVKGFYPGGVGEVAEAIEAIMSDQDNRATLVPVSGFAALGGASLKESVIWLPVRDIADVIRQLVELRRVLIDDVYQITGLSDILRGETNPNETLGAQELKAQTGSGRMKLKQEEMVRIARDATEIAAEIMSENFAPETLAAMSQTQLPSEQDVRMRAGQQVAEVDAMLARAQSDPKVMAAVQQRPELAQRALGMAKKRKQDIAKEAAETVTLDKVVQLLRDQRLRPFVLDIETDSTIQPDENAEKQRRSEFITAVGGFIAQIMPAMETAPQLGELAAEMLKFLASGYRAGRQLEGVIDQFAEQVKAQASQPKQDSATMKAQADAQAKQQDMQVRQMQAQADLQKMRMEMASDAEKARAEITKTQAEIQKISAEIERIKVQTEAAEETAEREPQDEAA